jgi:two-component system, cell cycle sensor histidine kinase and response regulator CckA
VPAALVVERDAVLRNIIRNVLTSQGFETMEAANAGEANALCQLLLTPPIDLLILDHAPIGAGGKSENTIFAEQLIGLAPTIKILVISECSFPVVSDEDGIPQGSWFLQKPFTPAQLLDTVKNILEPRIQ